MNEEIENIKQQISELEKKKAYLEKQLDKANDDFLIKFLKWYHNDEKGFYPFIITKEKFPLLSIVVNNISGSRYQTYTLADLIGAKNLYCFTNHSEAIKEFKESEINEIIEEYTPLFEEAMSNKMKSFTLDW
jgi:hypothetical protein